MKNFKLCTFLFFLIFAFLPSCLLPSSGQVKDKGIPFITHHSKKEYKAGTQNWDFTQDDNNVLYVANYQGVMSFDGYEWNLIPMPNRSIVRCLYRDESNRIYSGAYFEFGYLEPDSLGKLTYHSQTEKVPGFDFGDIWKIQTQGDFLYYQAFNGLIIHNRKLDTWQIEKPQGTFGFLHEAGGNLFLNHRGYGLMQVKDGKLFALEGGELFANWEIWMVTRLNGDLLIGTQNNGVFIMDNEGFKQWDSPINELLLEYQLFSFEESNENLFWGTIQDGLIVTDKKGNIITHLNKDTGLNNNTVLSLFIDSENNLWLGLDNGIDQILIHSQLSNLITKNDIGAGYCSAVYRNRLYLGTNQGLFWIRYNPDISGLEQIPVARSVPECSGQVWELKVLGDELMVGHNRGTFSIQGETVKHLYSEQGGWNFHALPGYEEYVLQGTYNGIVFYKRGAEGLEFDYKLEGFDLTSRVIRITRDRTIWVAHGYEGIFKLKLNDDLRSVRELKSYGEASNLGTSNFNELLATEDKIIVSNPNGIFIYNSATDDFEPARYWNKAFGEGGRLTGLIAGRSNEYYYFQDGGGGHLQIIADTLFVKDQGVLGPLHQSFLASFENASFIDDSEVLIGTDYGFVHLDLAIRRQRKTTIPFHFKNFSSLRNQSKLNYRLEFIENLETESPEHPLISIPYRDNDVRISFVSPYLSDPAYVSYSYRLDGQSNIWSEWSGETTIDFTNLREGEYFLRVKARNVSGEDEHKLFFHINTPWYRSVVAYVSYVLVFIMGIYIVWRIWNEKLARETRRSKLLEERRMLHKQLGLKQEAELAEQEIVKLRNDKLRVDIRHKSKQLANQTMGVLQKNRFLTEIKDEMVRLKKRAQNEEVISFMNKMIRKIDRNIEDEDTNRIFETNFDQVHENFIQRLQESFPHLTAKDLRLCAYLRMNLSSKEIAPLLNISVRGVEISRYRLRKKMDLDHNENLADFILRF